MATIGTWERLFHLATILGNYNKGYKWRVCHRHCGTFWWCLTLWLGYWTHIWNWIWCFPLLWLCACTHTYMQNKKCKPTKVLSWVSGMDWLLNVEEVKKNEVMLLMGWLKSWIIVSFIRIHECHLHIDPEFLLQPKVKHIFLVQLNILKSHFYHGKHKMANFVFIPLLDETFLDEIWL